MSSSTKKTYADEFVQQFMNEGNKPEKEAKAHTHEGAGADASLALQVMEEKIVLALKEVYDPEIPVNIYDLGLIYKIDIGDNGHVDVDMTLTAPGCPVAETFPGTVARAVNTVEGVSDTCVEIVWDPPWTMERMTEAAKLDLGFL